MGVFLGTPVSKKEKLASMEKAEQAVWHHNFK